MNPYISGRGVYYQNEQTISLVGIGNSYDETSPVVDLTSAPGVTSCSLIVGCSFFMPFGFGFGSLSGQIVVGSSGAQTIVLDGPLSVIAGRTIEFGVIPGLAISAANSADSFPVFVSASGDDLTLTIPTIAPGTYNLTQPFLGVFRN